MFGNTYLTSKYLRRLQQGGTIAAPDPSRFRTPLQGINPSVLQYNVDTRPLEVTPLLQVMQTKDTMDMQREKAALEREKLKAEADLAEKKLQHEQNKMMMNMMGDMFKVTGDASMGASGNPLYVGNDLMTSARFAPVYKQWQDKESQIVAELSKIAASPVGSTQAGTSFMNKMLELQRHRQNAPTTAQMSADHKSLETFWSVMSGTSKEKDLRVDPSLARKLLKQREDYLNGNDNGYELGLTPNSMQGLVYNEKNEAEKLKNIYTEINKPIKQETVDSNGKVVTTRETQKVLDPKLASQAILDRVWVDGGQKSYLSNLYGIDLWSVTPENEASVKELLRDRIQKTIEYDDQLYGGTTGITTNVSTQVLASDQTRKVVDMNYNISGKIEKNTNVTGLSQPGSKAPGDGKGQKVNVTQLQQAIPKYSQWGNDKQLAAKQMAQAQLDATGRIDGDAIIEALAGVEAKDAVAAGKTYAQKLKNQTTISGYGGSYDPDADVYDISSSAALMEARKAFEASANFPKNVKKPTDYTKVPAKYMNKFLAFLDSPMQLEGGRQMPTGEWYKSMTGSQGVQVPRPEQQPEQKPAEQPAPQKAAPKPSGKTVNIGGVDFSKKS